MARKKAVLNTNAVPSGLSGGIIAEFIIFIILQGGDLGCDYGVYLEAMQSRNTFEGYRSRGSPARNLSSSPIEYCSTSNFPKTTLNEKIDLYGNVLNIYYTFTVLATILFVLHFCLWVALMVMSATEASFLEDHWDAYAKAKLGFTLAANFVQDIPCSTMAVELFLLRRGAEGLFCWQCSLDASCTTPDYLDKLLATSGQRLTLLVMAISTTTLWKSISSFFRWSRVDQCDVFIIRACASLFAGFLYACFIMTPCMTILKYRYFALPGITPGLMASIVDKLFIFGALIWCLVLMAVCCCPCLQLIKLAQ